MVDMILTLLLILLPFLGAFIAMILSKNSKVVMILGISFSFLELALIIASLFISKGSEVIIPNIMMLGLSFSLDGFHLLYSLVSIFLWFVTIYFSKEYMKHYEHKSRYYIFYLLTLGAVVGVFLSNDLFTTFIFFEIMSFTSYLLVVHDEKKETVKAANTYLFVAVISGMILLMGLFLLYHQTNTLSFEKLKEYYTVNGSDSLTFAASILLLLGFGAKAGLYPLHIWLPKAHPVAPAPASALLSGILTKTGVYGIIVVVVNVMFIDHNFGFVLLVLALITMFLGALLGLFSTNLKRTLALSSMSQIGFILVGVAMSLLLGHHNLLATSGALMHMVNHSLIKLILFVAAGVVYMNIHKLDLDSIKGFGRNKYALMVVFIVAALGIMGIPLFNGYVSKTLIHESIVELIHENVYSTFFLKSVEIIFLVSGGFTIGYMCKIFVCLFIEKNNDQELQAKYDGMKDYLSLPTKGLLIFTSLILLFIGMVPNISLPLMINDSLHFLGAHAHFEELAFFSLVNLNGALISINIGVITYALIRKFLIKDNSYIDVYPEVLDLETLVYVPILKGISLGFLYVFYYLAYALDYLLIFLRKTILKEINYEFKDHSLAYNIGLKIDKLSGNETDKIAHKSVAISHAFKEARDLITTNFSFALVMLLIGITLVLFIVL